MQLDEDEMLRIQGRGVWHDPGLQHLGFDSDDEELCGPSHCSDAAASHSVSNLHSLHLGNPNSAPGALTSHLWVRILCGISCPGKPGCTEVGMILPLMLLYEQKLVRRLAEEGDLSFDDEGEEQWGTTHLDEGGEWRIAAPRSSRPHKARPAVDLVAKDGCSFNPDFFVRPSADSITVRAHAAMAAAVAECLHTCGVYG